MIEGIEVQSGKARESATRHVFERVVGLEVRSGARLAPLTTFRIGGPADLLLIPRSSAALEAAVRTCRRFGLALTVIGAGSDLLIADRGVRGVVLKIPAGLEPLTIDGPRLTAGAGRPLPELMRRAWQAGLSGLEFAGGIPGSLGGALVTNAGAWGREMAGIADRLRGIDADGRMLELDARRLRWSYRRAELPAGLVLTGASLRLTPGEPAAIAERQQAWHAARRQSQPLGAPSAGCVFKNPRCGAAGRLIEEAGLAGARAGGAMVSPRHANFMVSDGSATAADVMELIARVRAGVRARHGQRLELELRLVGLVDPEAGSGEEE